MKKDKMLFVRIAADIENELENVRKVKSDFLEFRGAYPIIDRFLLRALASFLEDFYNACEKVFKIIAEELNGGVPKGENWHKTLLNEMATRIGKRPAVLSPELTQTLVAFLGFRHIVRHVYGFILDASKVEDLAVIFPKTADRFCAEIGRFTKNMKQSDAH